MVKQSQLHYSVDGPPVCDMDQYSKHVGQPSEAHPIRLRKGDVSLRGPRIRLSN